jgi:uncharacterized membrane protein YbhN (UPF0104 family)
MSDGTPSRRRRLTKTHKRLLGGVGSVAVVIAVFVFVLPQFANYRDVLDVLGTLTWKEWLLLVGAVLLNLATFPPPSAWRRRTRCCARGSSRPRR